jgi:hypothetical protein
VAVAVIVERIAAVSVKVAGQLVAGCCLKNLEYQLLSLFAASDWGD